MIELSAFASLVGFDDREMCDERVPCTIVMSLRGVTLEEEIDLVANVSGYVRLCFFKHSTGPERYILYSVEEGRNLMRGDTYRFTPRTEFVK